MRILAAPRPASWLALPLVALCALPARASIDAVDEPTGDEPPPKTAHPETKPRSGTVRTAPSSTGEPAPLQVEGPSEAAETNEPPARRGKLPRLGPAAAVDAGGSPSGPAAVAAPSPPALLLPQSGLTDLLAHFRARQQALLDQDPKRLELESTALLALKSELAFPELDTVGLALVREGNRRLAGHLGRQALASAELAVALAPELPSAWWLQARARLEVEGPAAAGKVAADAWGALRTELASPLGQRALIGNLAVSALWAGLLSLGVVLALLSLGSLRYALHDFHHVFPKGAAPAQTSLLALILLAVPWLFNLGPFAILASLTGMAWLYLDRQGQVVAALALGLAVLAPFALAEIAAQTEISPRTIDLWTAQRELDAQPAADRLSQLLAEGAPVKAEVPLVLGLRAKRLGQLEEAERFYRQALALEPGRADLQNDLGNVLLLRGDLNGAKSQYQSAIDRDPTRAAPYFNLGQDFNRLLQLDQAQEAQRRALELDRSVVEGHLGQDVAANHFLADSPVAFAELLAAGANAPEATRQGVRSQAETELFGPFAPIWPALVVGAVLAIGVLGASRRRLHPSAACRKCGRAVCGRCDPGLPDEDLCGQCVNVFLRKAVADPPARIRKEARVREYQVLRMRVIRGLALLSGGGGHVALGEVALGTALCFAAAFFLVTALGWGNLLGAGDSELATLLISLFSALVLLILYLVSVRDLFARTR